MTATVPASAADVPRTEPGASGRPLGWWGMMTLITTEAMIFALLFFAYYYLRANNQKWPLGDIKDPELLKSGMRTIVLLGSSIPMHVAQKSIKEGNRRVAMTAMVIGWAMGALFLAGHVLEYLELWKEFTPSTNAYGSLFYTITGLHALHLTVGLIIVGWVLVRMSRGAYGEHNHLAVENSILYWHFVDAIWVFVYSSLYLSVTWL